MNKLVLIAIAFGCFQCASAYRPIDPPTLYYQVSANTDEIDLSYRHDILAFRGNRRYSKLEKKHSFNLVAVKLTNNTTQTLNLERDLELYTERGSVFGVEPQAAAKTMRQKVWPYLFWCFANLTIYDTDQYGNPVVSAFYPTGFIIAAINMIIAGTANKNMKQELLHYDLYKKDIAPGETAYGILPIRDLNYQPIKIRMKPSYH
jgi:hypothetical protein